MTDLYAVFGNPIAHSKSPAIHSAFARASGENLIYEARLAAVDGFKQAISDFQAAGGKGANVTVPFKEEAYRLCTRLSERAARAGAVNTLVFKGTEIFGDNTDGAGLVRDITHNLGCSLAGKRILLLGAGGAARGVIAPLLAGQPASLFIANRGADKATALARAFSDIATVNAGNFAET
ncbi:MAG TPA: shikimate dehydrogenase, partial [Azonexus sp.]|nr:shikimate dehydrogenase [Azonexus sp.]